MSSVSGSAANCFNSPIDELYWATLLTPRVTAIESSNAARLKYMDCWKDGAIDPFTHARWAALNSCCAEGVVISTVVDVVARGVEDPEMLHAPAPSEQSTTPAITNNMRDRLNVPVSELVTTLAPRKRKSDFAKTLKDEEMPGAG